MDRATERSSSQGGATILVVDDETLMLRLLKRFFSQHGYLVLEASDGDQAIEVYRHNQQQIDAVLLDIRIPKKTGAEVFHELKALNTAVKVVMASGFLEPQAKIDMTLAGVKHFVNKPYNLNELLGTFETLIKNK